MDELFKKCGLKSTKQRREVIDTLVKLDSDATIKNIAEYCNDIDLSTIYRIIELLLEKNILIKKINYDDEIYYAIKEEHGHYFTCIKCHKKEKIDICPVKVIDESIEKEKGFKVLNHVVEIEGICKNCQKNS